MTDDLTRDCLVILENLKDHLLNNPAAVAQIDNLLTRLRSSSPVSQPAPRPTEPAPTPTPLPATSSAKPVRRKRSARR